jgi:hypothetical protein
VLRQEISITSEKVPNGKIKDLTDFNDLSDVDRPYVSLIFLCSLTKSIEKEKEVFKKRLGQITTNYVILIQKSCSVNN